MLLTSKISSNSAKYSGATAYKFEDLARAPGTKHWLYAPLE